MLSSSNCTAQVALQLFGEHELHLGLSVKPELWTLDWTVWTQDPDWSRLVGLWGGGRQDANIDHLYAQTMKEERAKTVANFRT